MTASGLAPYDKRWWTLLILSTALLVISLDNTILNVALPTIERELDATSGQLQWIVDSYTLVFAGLLLTMGALGDRFSRRGALISGLVIFGGASLASAFAESANMLIATRALMGIGGALIMPTTCRSSRTSSPPRSGRRRSGSGRPWPASAWASAPPQAASCSSSSTGPPCSSSTSRS